MYRAFSFESLAENGTLKLAKLLDAAKQLRELEDRSRSRTAINSEIRLSALGINFEVHLYVKDEVSSMSLLLNDEDLFCAVESWGERSREVHPNDSYRIHSSHEEHERAKRMNNKRYLNLYMRYALCGRK